MICIMATTPCRLKDLWTDCDPLVREVAIQETAKKYHKREDTLRLLRVYQPKEPKKHHPIIVGLFCIGMGLWMCLLLLLALAMLPVLLIVSACLAWQLNAE